MPDLRPEVRVPRPRADQVTGGHGPGEARVSPGYGPARAACPEHGVRAGRVPQARHGSGHARDLGDWVACLAAGSRVSAHSRIAR